ncbi:MAG: lactoylglutathione lyase [Halonotius sp. J07HN6]|nr:MAG: lactoylglutathione lyase [Halonotius sp. J07HN6]
MSDAPPTPGIHHVTCIAGDPQQNLDFWVETLGLRLVKRSINQDDPTTYHFFFADAEGTPGTSMTFFPWENLRQGKVGTGQVSRTAFRVPEGSLDFWEDRFEDHGVDYEDRVERFDETVLPFYDPDGLPVELVAVDIPDDDPTVPWTEFVPDDAAIRGFHSVTLWLGDPQRTEDVLRTMGLDETASEALPADSRGEERTRFAATGTVGQYVDVVSTTATARQGHGTVHHVAFQTPSDADQSAMRTPCRKPVSGQRIRSTATGSGRCTSASRTGCCSNSPPAGRGTPATNRSTNSARNWCCPVSSRPSAVRSRLIWPM